MEADSSSDRARLKRMEVAYGSRPQSPSGRFHLSSLALEYARNPKSGGGKTNQTPQRGKLPPCSLHQSKPLLSSRIAKTRARPHLNRFRPALVWMRLVTGKTLNAPPRSNFPAGNQRSSPRKFRVHLWSDHTVSVAASCLFLFMNSSTTRSNVM